MFKADSLKPIKISEKFLDSCSKDYLIDLKSRLVIFKNLYKKTKKKWEKEEEDFESSEDQLKQKINNVMFLIDKRISLFLKLKCKSLTE